MATAWLPHCSWLLPAGLVLFRRLQGCQPSSAFTVTASAPGCGFPVRNGNSLQNLRLPCRLQSSLHLTRADPSRAAALGGVRGGPRGRSTGALCREPGRVPSCPWEHRDSCVPTPEPGAPSLLYKDSSPGCPKRPFPAQVFCVFCAPKSGICLLPLYGQGPRAMSSIATEAVEEACPFHRCGNRGPQELCNLARGCTARERPGQATKPGGPAARTPSHLAGH